MKKTLSLLLASAMVAGLIAGCGSAASSGTASADAGSSAAGSSAAAAGATAAESKAAETSQASSQASSGAVKTLQVVWFSDGKENESFMELADEYMKLHPDIKIELVETPYADLDSKLKNMVNGGQAPALARMTNLGSFQNQLVDLGEYIDKDKFIANFGSGLKFVYDDKVIAAPMDVTANGVIYNKTAFDKAGVKVPQSEDEIWTWEEFEADLQKVMENSDCKYGLVYDNTTQRFSTLLYEAGASFLNSDLTASNINTPEAARAVNYFKELHDKGIIPTSVWLGSETPQDMFRSGQVAAHIGGSWQIANYKNSITDFEWGVTYLPKDKQRSTVPGGKWLAAFKGSGVEKEAAEFIEWISQPEQNAKYCEENYYLSQVKGNESLNYDYGSDFFKTFSQELAATGTQPGAEWGFQAFTGAVGTDFKDGLADVLAGNTKTEDFLKSMDSEFTDTLADLKG